MGLMNIHSCFPPALQAPTPCPNGGHPSLAPLFTGYAEMRREPSASIRWWRPCPGCCRALSECWGHQEQAGVTAYRARAILFGLAQPLLTHSEHRGCAAPCLLKGDTIDPSKGSAVTVSPALQEAPAPRCPARLPCRPGHAEQAGWEPGQPEPLREGQQLPAGEPGARQPAQGHHRQGELPQGGTRWPPRPRGRCPRPSRGCIVVALHVSDWECNAPAMQPGGGPVQQRLPAGTSSAISPFVCPSVPPLTQLPLSHPGGPAPAV